MVNQKAIQEAYKPNCLIQTTHFINHENTFLYYLPVALSCKHSKKIGEVFFSERYLLGK